MIMHAILSILVNIHLSWLIIIIVLSIIDAFVSFTSVHWHINLLGILRLLHVQREILVVGVACWSSWIVVDLIIGIVRCSSDLACSSFDGSFNSFVFGV